MHRGESHARQVAWDLHPCLSRLLGTDPPPPWEAGGARVRVPFGQEETEAWQKGPHPGNVSSEPDSQIP